MDKRRGDRLGVLVRHRPERPDRYEPGAHHGSIGIEKRAGGPLFQVNVSDSFGSTWGPLARDGPNSDDWDLGLSISRKFF